MVALLCLVCFLSTVGGLLAGQSLKDAILEKEGPEKARRKMLTVGLTALGAALILSLLTLIVPMP